MKTTIQNKQDIHNQIVSLLDAHDIYNYKQHLYINKRGLRKILLAYNLNISVTKQTVTESLFICTVRVTNSDGRYIEATACQKLTEDSLFDIEKAQSRSTNRAIYDFYSLQELDLTGIYGTTMNKQESTGEIKGASTKPIIQSEDNTSSQQPRKRGEYKAPVTKPITVKQKSYLKKLISDDSEGGDYYTELINSLDELSSYDAGKLIHEMLQDKETTT